MGSTAHSAALRTGSGATSTSGGAAAAGSGNDAFRRLLTGSGPGQMNLGAVRARAEELKRSLDQIILALELYADKVLWGNALDKFGVVNLQLHQLTEELRPLLKFYAVHPKAVNAANAQQLPIMLATKALPEMEGEEAGLLWAHRDAAGDAPIGAQYEQLGVAIEHINNIVDTLSQHTPSSPASGLLDPKGPVRRKLAHELHLAAAVVPSAPKQNLPKQAQRPLKLEGPQLLMAAVRQGQGLR